MSYVSDFIHSEITKMYHVSKSNEKVNKYLLVKYIFVSDIKIIKIIKKDKKIYEMDISDGQLYEYSYNIDENLILSGIDSFDTRINEILDSNYLSVCLKMKYNPDKVEYQFCIFKGGELNKLFTINKLINKVLGKKTTINSIDVKSFLTLNRRSNFDTGSFKKDLLILNNDDKNKLKNFIVESDKLKEEFRNSLLDGFNIQGADIDSEINQSIPLDQHQDSLNTSESQTNLSANTTKDTLNKTKIIAWDDSYKKYVYKGTDIEEHNKDDTNDKPNNFSSPDDSYNHIR